MMNQYDYTNVLKMMPERGVSSILRETQIVCYTLSDPNPMAWVLALQQSVIVFK